MDNKENIVCYKKKKKNKLTRGQSIDKCLVIERITFS